MTSAAPLGGDDHFPQPSAAEVDARFSAIVSALDGQLDWDTAPAPETPGAAPDRPEDERARRRAQRRADRGAELAAYDAERRRRAEDHEADDEHFVPAEPPPVPRPRRRIVVAVILLAVSILLVRFPSALPTPRTVAELGGLLSLLAALALFGSLLRRRSADPADGDGWDDGARL